MHHSHFNSLESTQTYLREHLDQLKKIDTDILISTSLQTAGRGRNENTWNFHPNSLAMSFTLVPNKVPTLTPLEIGLLTIDFFKATFSENMLIKWPNDLMTSHKLKCGGILTQYLDPETVITGLGINIGSAESVSEENNNYKHGFGLLSSTFIQDIDQKSLSAMLYQFILNNRLNDYELLKMKFNGSCAHINKQVILHDDQKEIPGIFRSIGRNGEAAVEIEGTTKLFLSSSLTII